MRAHAPAGGEVRRAPAPVRAVYATALERGPIAAVLFENARLVAANEAAQALLRSPEVSATFLREVRALALRGHSIAPAVVEGETRRFRVHVVADEAAAAAYRVCFLLPFSGPSPSDLYQRRGLTRPEMRVAELLLQGMSNRSIAARFSRSIETVRKHVSHILRKCDVPNRTAFVAAVTGSRF